MHASCDVKRASGSVSMHLLMKAMATYVRVSDPQCVIHNAIRQTFVANTKSHVQLGPVFARIRKRFDVFCFE